MSNSKQDAADAIRDWVRVLLHKPDTKLATLEQLSLADLKTLWAAIDTAGAEWMNTLVHEAMKKPEPQAEPVWQPKTKP